MPEGLGGCSADRIYRLDPMASAQAGSSHLKERWLRRVSARTDRWGFE